MNDLVREIILEDEIKSKADFEYEILKKEIKVWEFNYIKRNYYGKEANRNKIGLFFINGLPYWDEMERAKKKVFGQKLKTILKMYFFSEGFQEVVETNYE